MSTSTFPYDETIPAGAPEAGKTPRALLTDVLTRIGEAYNAVNEAINSSDGDLGHYAVNQELNRATDSLEGIGDAIFQAQHAATMIATYQERQA